jgi:hypothetical protein
MLAAALARLGFNAEVLRDHEYRKHACVVVTSGPARTVKETGYVYAGPDAAGTWWFWRSVADDPVDLEPVAPISDVSVTADAVARSLTAAQAVFPQAG